MTITLSCLICYTLFHLMKAKKTMQDILIFLQHHWALVIPLVVILVLLMVIELIKQKQSAARVSCTQLTQLINHENATVIDIRSATLFAEGHVIGAQSIPSTEIEEKIKKLEKLQPRPIILTCQLGHDSPKVAALLIKQGLDARILAGGIRAWREAGMPLVKE